MKLEEAAKYAADLLLSLPKKSKVRIIGHVDADGICSACIVAMAIARIGYRFHISIKRTEPELIKEIEKEENDLYIFTDIGASYLKEMGRLKTNVIVLEHHLCNEEDIPSNVMYLNARLYNLDGSREACGASVAYAFAIALDEENVDLSQLAVAGMYGDKQKFLGYNKKIIEDGIGEGFIDKKEEYIFSGNLKEAIENSIEPYFTKMQSSTSFLEEIELQPQKKFEELEEEERKKLLSFLTLKLIEQNVSEIEWKRKNYYGKDYGNLREMASKLNACARLNEAGVGISLCLGDKKAIEKAHMLQEKYRDEIRKEMRSLEKKEPYEMKNFIYFYTDKPPLAGILAGLSLKYLPQFKKNKPVIAIAYNDFLDISGRADEKMVENGINLGEAIKKAAEAAGGIGGGHPVAAGAKIKKEMEKVFLEELDKELG